MITELCENLTVKTKHVRKRNIDCICNNSSNTINLNWFFNSEFHKCVDLKDFKERFNNLILFSVLFTRKICYNSGGVDPYNFRNIIKNLINVYINYDGMQFEDVEYHPLNSMLLYKKFDIAVNGRIDDYGISHYIINKDGIPININYDSCINMDNKKYIVYGCYIIIFNDTATNIKKRYIVCYRSLLNDYDDHINVPLIKKLTDDEYNKIHKNIDEDTYYPEIKLSNIQDYFSSLDFN